MKLFCRGLRLHDWDEWRQEVMTVVDPFRRLTGKQMINARNCKRCKFAQIKEIR